MRYVVVFGLLLVLTGCGPNTDGARSNCLRVGSGVWQINNPDASHEEFADALEQIRQECNADAESNPEKFVEVYG